MKKIALILGTAFIITSCGGGGGLNKDSKADHQMEVTAIDALDDSNDQAAIGKYDDKIIEVKGVIKSSKEAKHASSPNKYSFFLCTTTADEDTNCIICYTDEDLSASTGKTVTVKGKFSYAGVITLIDCAVY
jgi:tRNA_anti-like